MEGAGQRQPSLLHLLAFGVPSETFFENRRKSLPLNRKALEKPVGSWRLHSALQQVASGSDANRRVELRRWLSDVAAWDRLFLVGCFNLKRSQP